MKKTLFSVLVSLIVFTLAIPARADFWGGDLAFLAQILQQSILEVQSLQSILGSNQDSLNFMRQINSGLYNALDVMNTMNRTLQPGNFSNLANVTEVIGEVQSLYGRIPQTSEAKLETAQDLSVAESIELHNDAFRYADATDPEAERLKDYAQVASPQGAAKASLQAEGMQIHVLNQILRTQAALLKVQSEQLAMQNRHAKLQSEQFRAQYGEISKAFDGPKPGFDLPSISSQQ